MYGQKENSYTLTKRQINKIKGWELTFYPKNNMWGESLGFFKTLKEAQNFAITHKNKLTID